MAAAAEPAAVPALTLEHGRAEPLDGRGSNGTVGGAGTEVATAGGSSGGGSGCGGGGGTSTAATDLPPPFDDCSGRVA